MSSLIYGLILQLIQEMIGLSQYCTFIFSWSIPIKMQYIVRQGPYRLVSVETGCALQQYVSVFKFVVGYTF